MLAYVSLQRFRLQSRVFRVQADFVKHVLTLGNETAYLARCQLKAKKKQNQPFYVLMDTNHVTKVVLFQQKTVFLP